MKRSKALLAVALILSGCGSHKAYQKAGVGEFEGVLEVRWLEPDRFLFVPNKDNPLRFSTSEGARVIEPRPMYTDGGSIPRIFWSVPGYSPWGLAPAYIIHDWLFMAHHCNTSGYEDVVFSDSSRIMGESIKTLMETDTVAKDESLFFNVVAAVRTPIARKLWDTGECDLPPEVLAYGTVREVQPLLAEKSQELRLKLERVERDAQAASDSALKQKLTTDASRLRIKLDAVKRLSTATAARRVDEPAARLLYTIDMRSPQ